MVFCRALAAVPISAPCTFCGHEMERTGNMLMGARPAIITRSPECPVSCLSGQSHLVLSASLSLSGQTSRPSSRPQGRPFHPGFPGPATTLAGRENSTGTKKALRDFPWVTPEALSPEASGLGSQGNSHHGFRKLTSKYY